jgi:hypothetical protein
MAKRRYRPTRKHRHGISVSQKARYARIRQALDLLAETERQQAHVPAQQ